jgi:hypothetical protein
MGSRFPGIYFRWFGQKSDQVCFALILFDSML